MDDRSQRLPEQVKFEQQPQGSSALVSHFRPFLSSGAGSSRCRAVLQQCSTMKDIHIKVSDEEHTALTAICRQKERTISDVLREKIRQFIAENKAQEKKAHR